VQKSGRSAEIAVERRFAGAPGVIVHKLIHRIWGLFGRREHAAQLVVKEVLHETPIVIPAEAGIQAIQIVTGSRLSPG
jgi:hypothetical protein